EVLQKIVYFKVPTIALLNGNALGGGCELATACDFRIAKRNCQFGFVQSNLGILPGWGGGAVLYEKVNPNFAFHWLTSGERYSAEMLRKKGWIDQIVDQMPLEGLNAILKPYLKNSHQQMVYLKQQYLQQFHTQLIDGMKAETKRCSMLWGSSQHQQAINTFLEK